MANVRELLARLNPQTIRYDVGSGGNWADKLSNQDIAAALAFVPAGLGREVLIACWWPDGGSLDRKRLLGWVTHTVRTEWQRQGRALAEAKTDLGIAEACANWNGRTTPEQRAEVERARNALDRVRAECWPESLSDRLPAIVSACLAEIAYRNHCGECAGRGELVRGELVVKCQKCGGNGTLPTSERHRAQSLGMHVETYRERWAGVYGWILRAMIDAESEAAAALSRALRQAA